MIWYIKNLQTFAPVVTCKQNLYQNALKEPKTFDPAVTCAQLQKQSTLKENKIYEPAPQTHARKIDY